MDSHPYGYETSIFTLGAPHEEVQGRQAKLHPGFTLGNLVQPSPGISILGDSHIVLSKRSCLDNVLQNFLIGSGHTLFSFFAFFYKKWHLRKKFIVIAKNLGTPEKVIILNK